MESQKKVIYATFALLSVLNSFKYTGHFLIKNSSLSEHYSLANLVKSYLILQHLSACQFYFLE